MTAGEFWDKIDYLCLNYGGSITSGRRTARHNKAVGGADHSHHVYGFAADIVLDDMITVEPFWHAVKAVGLHFLVEGDHIHVQDVGVGVRCVRT